MPVPISPAADPAAQQTLPIQTTPVTPPVTPPEPPVERTFEDDARDLGFENVKDEADFHARLKEAYRLERETAQAAQRRAREMEELAYLRAQQAMQVQPQPQAQQPNEDPYAAPQVNLELVGMFRNDDGTWKPETPPELRQQFQKYEAYRKQWSQKLLDRPKDALQPIIDQIVVAKIAERLAAMESKTEEEALRQRFLREADWAFQVDPRTNQRQRDAAGNFIVSADGAKFGEYMNEAASLGLASFPAQLKYAERLRAADLAISSQTQQTTTQQLQDNAARLKQDLTNRALQNPQRSGTFSKPGDPPGRPQNRPLSLGEKTLALMQANGQV